MLLQAVVLFQEPIQSIIVYIVTQFTPSQVWPLGHVVKFSEIINQESVTDVSVRNFPNLRSNFTLYLFSLYQIFIPIMTDVSIPTSLPVKVISPLESYITVK